MSAFGLTFTAILFRYNLDPEGIHSEDSLWEALEQVNLKDTVKYLSGQLGQSQTFHNIIQQLCVLEDGDCSIPRS